MPSLLAGMIYDGEGRPMAPRHATKGSQRYRYYVTAADTADRRTPASAWEVPTSELDQLVRERLAGWLALPRSVLDVAGEATSAADLPELLGSAAILAQQVTDMPVADLRALLLKLAAQVQVDRDQLLISLSTAAPLARLSESALAAAGTGADTRRTIVVPAALTRRGHELRLAFAPHDRSAPS